MIGKVIFHETRDRRQIKNKFKREEMENPVRDTPTLSLGSSAPHAPAYCWGRAVH
jgi:hypothetical protein